MPPKTALSIDPGINALGWALWSWNTWERCERPMRVGVIKKRTPSPDPLMKMGSLMKNLTALALGDLRLVVCEWAQFRAGSAVGHSAASRDDLGNLCHNHGMIHWWAMSRRITFRSAPVSTWKGNLPKRVTEQRIQRGIGKYAANGEEITSHAWDAVGIGLWAKGYDLADGGWQR